MLPASRVVLLRFSSSTATAVQRRALRPKWLVGAVAAGVVGGTWFAASIPDDDSAAGDEVRNSQVAHA